MKKIVALAATITMIVSISAARVYSEQTKASERAGRSLRLIETYKAPPYPVEKTPENPPGAWDFRFPITRETYDYRKDHGRTVPPSLTDVFIVDLWQRMTKDLTIPGIAINKVSEDHVLQAMNIYLQRDWKKIAGYRPWTHWNFIRSLNEQQRNGLAKEVVS